MIVEEFIEGVVEAEHEVAQVFMTLDMSTLSLDMIEEEPKPAEIEHVDYAIKLYMREIHKAKLLSADEEKELALRHCQRG